VIRPGAAVLLALLGAAAAAAGPDPDPDVRIEAALALDPEPPVAGAPLTVRLAPELLAPGRELRLVDAVRGTVTARFLLGRQGIARVRFEVPASLTALRVELHNGDGLVLATPDATVRPAPAAPADVVAGGEPAPGNCPDLAPDEDAGRAALAAWLADCPLDHALLRGRDLSGVDLAGRSLRRADLDGADLSDARLAGADLSGAVLVGARLDGADLSGARLEVADLSHASLFVTDLAGADLRGADLRGATLTDVTAANADLGGARLAGAALVGVDFTGAVCPDGVRTLEGCADHLELP
jgi:hypothetical protein